MVTIANWFHAPVKTISRSNGRSATASAAYRLAARIEDERVQIVHDYRAKGGVVTSFTVAPKDAPAWALEPERLWNAAELAERRRNSTLAREIELALPASVDAETRLSITEAVAAELVNRYQVAVSAAIHLPSTDGDDRNHHAHIMFTTREMTAEGLGAKTRVLDDQKTGPQEVRYLRAFVCDVINDALEEAGSDERVDHRSYAERGIDQEPTTHLGPRATEMERRGVPSDLGDQNREVQTRNKERSQLDELVDELAALDREIAREIWNSVDDDDIASPIHDAWRDIEDDEDLAADIWSAPATQELQPEDAPAGDSDAPLPDAVLSESRGEKAAVPDEEEGSDMAVPPLQANTAQDDFSAVHAETLQAARDEQVAMAQEEAPDRFARLRSWWGNVCNHFVEWRGELQERFAVYWDRTEAQPASPAPPSGEEPSAQGIGPDF